MEYAENFQNRIFEAMSAIKEANDADLEAKAAMAEEMQKKKKGKKRQINTSITIDK